MRWSVFECVFVLVILLSADAYNNKQNKTLLLTLAETPTPYCVYAASAALQNLVQLPHARLMFSLFCANKRNEMKTACFFAGYPHK